LRADVEHYIVYRAFGLTWYHDYIVECRAVCFVTYYSDGRSLLAWIPLIIYIEGTCCRCMSIWYTPDSECAL